MLHGLIERVGNLGVHTLEELVELQLPGHARRSDASASSPTRCRSAPGVYLFKDGSDRVLYVGTSRDIRTRVRTYFTASEQRSRMAEMVRLAHVVHPIVCQTSLEAQVRELRLIDEHKPRFNRRSKDGRKVMWVKLTQERFPRLSIVKQVSDDDAHYIGPFRSRVTAQSAIDAVHEVVPLRQCTGRLTGRGTACALADMGRCGAPCTGAQSEGDYAVVVDECRAIFTGNARPSADLLRARLEELASQERFEDAARVRDRFLQLVRGAARAQRLAPLARSPRSSRPVAATLGGLGARLHPPRSPGRHRGEPARRRPDALRPLDAGHGRGRAPADARASVRAHRGDRDPAALARGAGRAHRRARRDLDLSRRRRRLGAQRARARCRIRPRGRRLRPRRAALATRSPAAGGAAGQAAACAAPDEARLRCPVITAIVMISCEVDRIPEVAEAIADIPAVSEVYSVTGDADLIAMVRVKAHEEFADVIADQLNKVQGIVGTSTHIAFRTYSSHDLEAAFSLGPRGRVAVARLLVQIPASRRRRAGQRRGSRPPSVRRGPWRRRCRWPLPHGPSQRAGRRRSPPPTVPESGRVRASAMPALSSTASRTAPVAPAKDVTDHAGVVRGIAAAQRPRWGAAGVRAAPGRRSAR